MSSISLEELHRRLRNRIIEHLELVSSRSEQLSYQADVPIAQVSDELFNGWGDWVADEAVIAEFGPPVFTGAEVSAIREFDQKLRTIAAATPGLRPPISEFLDIPEWQALSSAAQQALLVFAPRGLSPEQ